MDPYKFLKISRNADGSLTRLNPMHLSFVGAGEDPDVLSRDFPLNHARSTSLRAFIPRRPSSDPAPPPGERRAALPIIIYFHAGGFIHLHPATAPFHAACAMMASAVPAIVLSIRYRLAPEHRLPAAYDDAVEAVLWVRSQAIDPDSLLASADFSRCFIAGSSSGANVALHAAVRMGKLDLSPASVVGLILDQPFLGGTERTDSERRMENDRTIPLPVNDLVWELALPEGASRDHEYCNPEKIQRGMLRRLPRCMVRGHLGDPLTDRHRRLTRMLEEEGVSVAARLDSEGYHMIEVSKPGKLAAMVADVRSFVHAGAGDAVERDASASSVRHRL